MFIKNLLRNGYRNSSHYYFISRSSMATVENNGQNEAQVAQKCIEEGQAKIYMTSDKVFYNPVQEFNRDLSIAVINLFRQDYMKHCLEKNLSSDEHSLTILEALSASGLRSIRYAKEIPSVSKIVANDISQKAVESIKTNVQTNNVEDLVETSHDDASLLMYKCRRIKDQFTVIDLDPYGCPSIFLDSAVQSVKNGGLLLVTATDMAILAGNSPETCYYKYGAVSLKTKSCHEMALRILLQSISSHANRYCRYIVPILSISVDFYIRVFVRIFNGAHYCKKTTSQLSMVYHCVGCDNLTLQKLGAFKPREDSKQPNMLKACLPQAPQVERKCVHCNSNHHMGGPIWTAPIHDGNFVSRLLLYIEDNKTLFGTGKRMEGVLSVVNEELHDIPLYYTTDKLFSTLHLETMPMMQLRSAIMNGGYRVSYSHAAKNSVKTDAPPDFIWDILKTWEKTHPVKKETVNKDPVAAFIMGQEIKHKIDLTERPNSNPMSRVSGRLRFQANPTPHWGPGTRATARVGEDRMEKSQQNQNKTFGRVSTKELKQLKRKISNEHSEDLHDSKKGVQNYNASIKDEDVEIKSEITTEPEKLT